MDNNKVENINVEEITEEELKEATGAKGSGWFRTITDDCPNSVIVCC